jgi:hypothetical protein
MFRTSQSFDTVTECLLWHHTLLSMQQWASRDIAAGCQLQVTSANPLFMFFLSLALPFFGSSERSESRTSNPPCVLLIFGYLTTDVIIWGEGGWSSHVHMHTCLHARSRRASALFELAIVSTRVSQPVASVGVHQDWVVHIYWRKMKNIAFIPKGKILRQLTATQ